MGERSERSQDMDRTNSYEILGSRPSETVDMRSEEKRSKRETKAFQNEDGSL